MARYPEIPDHPEIACALRTGSPRECKSILCADCQCEELYGDKKIYIRNDDIICGDCLKEWILENYDIDELADAFDIRRTTADDYFEKSEEDPYDGD